MMIVTCSNVLHCELHGSPCVWHLRQILLDDVQLLLAVSQLLLERAVSFCGL